MSKHHIGILFSALLSACVSQDYGKLSKLPDQASVPAEYREEVAFVKDVRKFGIEQLGLYRNTQQYTTFSETDGQAQVMYRLFVAKPTVLPDTWEEASQYFWSDTAFRDNVGAMYFTSFEDTLEDELKYYQKKGYDVHARNVISYNLTNSEKGSSITPNFFKVSKAWQAQTIIHEICHDSVEEWIGDDFPEELNEPFCSLVGRAGAVEYFKMKEEGAYDSRC